MRHEVNGAAHFDLMLEVAGQDRLRTLQMARWPLAVGETCAAPELPPHRRDYLEYQGEVSGGRGRVQRVAAGHWTGDDSDIALDGAIVLRWNSGTIVRTK